MPKVNQNLKMTWQTLLRCPCCQIWTGLTLSAMLLVYTLNRYLCVELTFNWFLKMSGEIKRSILNVNLTKYSKQIQHSLIDLKMKIFTEIVNDFKLFLQKRSILDVSQVLSSALTALNQTFFTSNKRTTSRFFGTVSFTTQSGFYLL